MTIADRLAWAIARHVAVLPAGTAFTATSCATLGVRIAQEKFGSKLCLCGRGGAYDLNGILSLHARHWLFNRRPRAHVILPGVFDTQSEPHILLATPAQVDGSANANLSCIGEHGHPKVAFGGTRGLPDARTVWFVLPNHTPRQLVETVDFVSTCAANRERPPMLFTGLGTMQWNRVASGWTLVEIAPETDIEELRKQTGFRFEVSPVLRALEEMPADLGALVVEFDPFGLRELDFAMAREAQLAAFERIYRAEADLVGRDKVPAHKFQGSCRP